MRLHYKIMLLVCALALGTGTAITYVAKQLMSDALVHRFEKEGEFIAHSLSETLVMRVVRDEVVPVLDSLRKVVSENDHIDYIFITDFNQTLFAHSFSGGFPSALLSRLSNTDDSNEPTFYETRSGSIIHISWPLISGMDARLHIGMNDNVTQTRINKLGETLAIIAAAIMLVAAGVGGLVSRRVSRPLSRLTRLMQSYGRGEPIEPSVSSLKWGDYEVTNLYNAFSSMVSKLDLSIEKIRDSENSLIEAQRIARLGNWDWNIQAGTLHWSDEIFRIFGLIPKEFDATYEAFLNSVHPDDHALVTETVSRAIGKENEPYRIDHRIVLPDGTVRIVHEHGEVMRNEEGEAVRMVGTVQDITERKLVEQELEQYRFHLEELVEQRTTTIKQREAELKALTSRLQASNQELEAFSYSVSHDLRAPLRSIDGFSMALLEDYHEQLDEAGRDYLTRVRKSAQKMATLIDDLLQLSRISRSELKFGTVNLSRLAEAVVDDLRAGELERSVDVTIAPDLCVRGDATLLEVLLNNLIGNAWKFTRKQLQAGIEIGSTLKDKQSVFFIRDNGAGFDMKYADNLFGAFKRLHGVDQFEGTGIGLATVQRVIKRHGGRIWAEAEVDKGATFYFSLPEVASR